jgi:Flp pilus assembly pilin Flp
MHSQQKARQRGQGMTEYIIIVALIAVAAIAVYQFFGQTIDTVGELWHGGFGCKLII